jgi:release factor glutamine methyltransferase
MTLREWLAQAEAQLCTGPHPDRAKRDAETLLLHLIGKSKAWLMANANDDFAGCTAIRYASLLERRRKGEPIQYITGETEFYGLPFLITPDVLIPRPETELLVEKVLACAATELGAPSLTRTLGQGWESTITNTTPTVRQLRILDIGTGSGAIAVTLAHHLTLRTAKDQGSVKGTGFSPYINFKEFAGALASEGCVSENPPAAHITAADISPAALALAAENAARNGVADKIRFLQGDLLAPVAEERFEIIVSNPPYVPAADRDSLSVEVRDHEPHVALFAGNDGLEIYRRLIPQAFSALTPGGFIALEIGHGQQPAIHTLLEDAGFGDIQFTPDLQGIPRVAVARRP